MILFPPFASLSGTEYAFLLTGPGWARGMEAVAGHLGLTTHIQWPVLIVQLAALWAIALGAVWFLRQSEHSAKGFGHAFVLGCFSLMILPLATVATANANPISTAPTDTTVGMQGGKFGVGFASSWPAYGISGTYQVNPAVTAEAVIGLLGTVSNFGGRLWYRFNRNHNYDLYAYGAASIYRYGYYSYDLGLNRRRESESVLGLGGGAGFEYGLRSLMNDQTMPPVFFNVELGIALASFEYYNFSSFVWGGGIHYRFGR